MLRLKAYILGNAGLGFALGFVALLIVAGLILAAQCLCWSRYGYWEPYPLLRLLLDLNILGTPRTPTVALDQTTIELVLSWPAAGCLVGAAGVFFAVASFLLQLADHCERERRKEANAARWERSAQEVQKERR